MVGRVIVSTEIVMVVEMVVRIVVGIMVDMVVEMVWVEWLDALMRKICARSSKSSRINLKKTVSKGKRHHLIF